MFLVESSKDMTVKEWRSFEVRCTFKSLMPLPALYLGIAQVPEATIIRHGTLNIQMVGMAGDMPSYDIVFSTVQTERTACDFRQLIRDIGGEHLIGGILITEEERKVGTKGHAPELELLVEEEIKLEGPKIDRKGKYLTEQEMMTAVTAIFPNATLGEDNDGQLIIYTDCEVQTVIVPMPEV